MNSGINMKNRTSCPKELCGIFTQTNKEKSFSSSACPNFAQKEHLLQEARERFFSPFSPKRGVPQFFNRNHLFLPHYFWVASHCVDCVASKQNHLPKMLSMQYHFFFSPNKSSLVVDPKNQLQTECASKCKTSVEITPLNIL